MGIKDNSENKGPMADKYMIACEIYHHNKTDSKIWFNKLVDIFGDAMKVNVVSDAIDELYECGIISSTYSTQVDQYKGVVFLIVPEYVCKISDCYNNIWKHKRDMYLSRFGRIEERRL